VLVAADMLEIRFRPEEVQIRSKDAGTVAGVEPGLDVNRAARTRRTWTASPASLQIAFRMLALTGSVCVPSPIAVNELRKPCPSIVASTFTSPRVRKNATETGITTYVQPPFALLLRRVAVNSRRAPAARRRSALSPVLVEGLRPSRVRRATRKTAFASEIIGPEPRSR
jgi:hypothetical protein